MYWESVDPPSGYVTCLFDGSRSLGESCSIDLDLGVDDCVSGLLCWELLPGDPRCAEICTTEDGDSCSVGTCVLITDVFECFGSVTGVCMP